MTTTGVGITDSIRLTEQSKEKIRSTKGEGNKEFKESDYDDQEDAQVEEKYGKKETGESTM